MTVIVDGLYTHGKLELLQAPVGVPEGPVRLILISPVPPSPATPCFLTYAKYQGDASSPDDFKDAQWQGEQVWDDRHGQ